MISVLATLKDLWALYSETRKGYTSVCLTPSYDLGDECKESTGSTTATVLPTSASTANETTPITTTNAPNEPVVNDLLKG